MFHNRYLTGSETLREKYPHSEFFWPVHLDWIQRDTMYLSVFSPNTGKYGPEKLWIRALFTQWNMPMNTVKFCRPISVSILYIKSTVSFFRVSNVISNSVEPALSLFLTIVITEWLWGCNQNPIVKPLDGLVVRLDVYLDS